MNSRIKHLTPVRVLIMALLLLALLMAGCGGGKKDDPADSGSGSGSAGSGREKAAVDTRDQVKCPLTGEMVSREALKRRPLAVMIENSPAARPQSGLNKADIVYEMLAEGDITRFLAVFLHGDTAELGPVRSARPYFITRALDYNAVYVYCGGSEAAKKNGSHRADCGP